ncbi:hypothetical protein Pcinc_039941 [Petrolisthes cinctipes]|uniref:Uncharacterized protein n=1 Tax=Petrolisthes cinctipes TaxID=88211 RepID=A0AAE1EIL2_PETCI|nr:hypothetical protein Pcinc_039941 [Petrolisthes cinctipes]
MGKEAQSVMWIDHYHTHITTTISSLCPSAKPTKKTQFHSKHQHQHHHSPDPLYTTTTTATTTHTSPPPYLLSVRQLNLLKKTSSTLNTNTNTITTPTPYHHHHHHIFSLTVVPSVYRSALIRPKFPPLRPALVPQMEL